MKNVGTETDKIKYAEHQFFENYLGMIFNNGKKYRVAKREDSIGGIDYEIGQLADKIIDLENAKVVKCRYLSGDYADFELAIEARLWPVLYKNKNSLKNIIL